MRRTAIALALLLVAGASVAPSAGAQQVSDLEVLSQGNGGGDSSYYFPAYFDSTDDLSRVYFGTYGKLTPEDGDEFGYDVFEGTGTETRLISTGPDDAEQNLDIEWGDASADGSARLLPHGRSPGRRGRRRRRMGPLRPCRRRHAARLARPRERAPLGAGPLPARDGRRVARLVRDDGGAGRRGRRRGLRRVRVERRAGRGRAGLHRPDRTRRRGRRPRA